MWIGPYTGGKFLVDIRWGKIWGGKYKWWNFLVEIFGGIFWWKIFVEMSYLLSSNPLLLTKIAYVKCLKLVLSLSLLCFCHHKMSFHFWNPWTPYFEKYIESLKHFLFVFVFICVFVFVFLGQRGPLRVPSIPEPVRNKNSFFFSSIFSSPLSHAWTWWTYSCRGPF